MLSEPKEVDFTQFLEPTVKATSVDDVVKQLMALLLSGEVSPGQRLPSERALCAMFSVGRTTVREALRTLQAQGFLEIRLGGSGGAFFRGPDPGTVGSALSMLLQFNAASEQDLHDFRLDFEQRNAELAALHANRDQHEQLRRMFSEAQALDPAADGDAVQAFDLRLHEFLPALTQNTVRVAISQGIHDAMARSFAAFEVSPARATLLKSDMLRLLEALVARDSAEARQAMADHLIKFRFSPLP